MSTAMIALTEFAFNTSPIRVVGTKHDPWFVGVDVATALGYKNPQEAVRKHVPKEDKGVSELLTPGGKQKFVVIDEAGLYYLVFRSKLPSAQKFTSWVTHEVLPSIRRYGYYKVPKPPKAPKLPKESKPKGLLLLEMPYVERFKSLGETGKRSRLANGEELNPTQVRLLCCDLGADVTWVYDKSTNQERVAFINTAMADQGYRTLEEVLKSSTGYWTR